MSAKYVRLANYLRSMIAQSQNNFIKLPTEQELCRQYGVSRQTVRKALSVLAGENLIQKKQGSGSYAFKSPEEAFGNSIALLLSSDSEYSYPSLITDIRSRLSGQGYSVTVYITDNRIAAERDILNQLLVQPVRGLIAEGCKNLFPSPNMALYDRLQARGTAVLFLYGACPNLKKYRCLQGDDYAGAYYLCHYLILQSHTRIAGIFQNDTQAGANRCHGYLAALCDRNLPIIDEHICWYDSRQLSFLRQKQDTGFLSEFIHKRLSSCSAVICHTDEIAYWLVKELTYAGVRVPWDLSVVCFHNTYLNDLSSVHITALSHRPHEMGHAAADRLRQLLKGSSASDAKLPFHLVERGSVRPFTE